MNATYLRASGAAPSEDAARRGDAEMSLDEFLRWVDDVVPLACARLDGLPADRQLDVGNADGDASLVRKMRNGKTIGKSKNGVKLREHVADLRILR
jgi:hypothetical protein